LAFYQTSGLIILCKSELTGIELRKVTRYSKKHDLNGFSIKSSLNGSKVSIFFSETATPIFHPIWDNGDLFSIFDPLFFKD